MVRLDKIFDVVYGANLELVNCEVTNPEDGIPFVSRTSRNNGVVAYIKEVENVTPNPKHTLSVAGSGSVLSTFYQEKSYYSGRDLFYLKPKVQLSKIEMLFYCMIIKSNSYKYSYGRQANKTIKEILIPSVQEIPKSILSAEIAKPKNKSVINKSLKVNLGVWKYFQIDKLFTLEKCKCSSAIELLQDGDEIFYIGAKKSDNGVMNRVIKDDDLVSNGNCIVFIGDGQGSIGYTTYQPDDFIGSSTLTCGYNPNLNWKNALFIVTVLDLERYRYSFGRKYGKEQVKKSRIKLPSRNGEPDFEYMENYIKSLPYSASL